MPTPLVCNVLACLLLVALRVSEAASLFTEHALLPTKLRTSCCGALSMSGGVSALIVAGHRTPPEKGARTNHDDDEAHQLKHHTPRRRVLRAAAINFGLHCYVAAAVCAVLPGMTAVAYGHAAGQQAQLQRGPAGIIIGPELRQK